jgi:hypothetical protein
VPTPQADHLRELLRVSRLLRQYVDLAHAGEQSSLFLAAAEALETRARRLAHLKETPPRIPVDLHC